MLELILLFTGSVVLARPTDSTSTQESENESDSKEESEEDSAKRSSEERDSNTTSTGKANFYIETATSHDRYSPVLPSFEHNNEERNGKEYGSPGPPDRRQGFTPATSLSQNATEIRNVFSKMSMDNVPSENNMFSNGGRQVEVQRRPVSYGERMVSVESLSEDNLSVDARACALPKRRPKGAITKEEKLALAEDRKQDNGDTCQKQDKGKIERKGSIEDFIRQLVHEQMSPQARIKFFDAAIVYEKEDYYDALNFKEEVIMIVKSALNEEVRIELFDSEEFAQSKIIVVDDILNRCSLVFVYLTVNFKSPELMFFIEEAIGLSRLGLNNENFQVGTVHDDRQWVLKPIHTMPPKFRAYRVPTGLLSVNGIEWYNRDSPHTRQQICAVIHKAVQTRKDREMQASIPYSDSRKIGHNHRRQIPDRRVQDTTDALKPNIGNLAQCNQDNFISHQSHDAMSFVGHLSSPQMNSFPKGQRLQNAPLMQTNQVNSNIYSDVRDFRHPCHNPLGQRYGSVFPGQDMTRDIPTYIRNNGLVPDSQYPQALSQIGQHHLPPTPQQFLHQSAGLQNRNGQPSGSWNVLHHPNQQNTNIYQEVASPYNGNGQMYNHPNECMPPAVQQTNFPGHRNTDPRYQGQRNWPEVSAPAYSWQDNQQVQSQMRDGVPIYRHGVHQQIPLRHQVPLYHQNVQQQFSHYQGQPLSRDALPSETRNFLTDQRNDALPSSQLSVVSKVTGNLIVNPNLSTDDVEIDNYAAAQSNRSKVHGRSGKHKGNRTNRRQNYAESESEESSSSDSDFDIPRSKVTRGKQKVVNVVGCKIVQMGSRNKVKEHARKCFESVEESPVVKSKCLEDETKNSPGNTDNSCAGVSQNRSQTATTNSNIMSTDAMSVQSSVARNLNTEFDRKQDKNGKLNRVTSHCGGQLLKRNIPCDINQPNMAAVSKEEHFLQNIITWNDRNNRFCSQRNSSSFENQDSTIESRSPSSPDENISDGDDCLFESGIYSAGTVSTDTVAPFTFTHATKSAFELLMGRRCQTTGNSKPGSKKVEDSEID